MAIENKNLSKQSIKDSAYSFSAALLSKIGGLIFTIIIARILLPELFGIYSLVLSILVIAITFTDLGISSASIRYMSEALGKRNKKRARGYFRYLLKLKFSLIFLVILILLLISRYLSYNVFNKPLVFLSLTFASIYLLVESLRGFIMNLFITARYLKPTPFLEILHQLSKILLSVLAVSLFLTHLKIPALFIAFTIAGVLSLGVSLLVLFKKDKTLFVGKSSQINKKRVLNYVGFMGIASLSLVFFASVDTLMLGRFVEANYIGYYRAATSLILAISALLSLSGILLPAFTQISRKRLERGFSKTLRYILMFSLPLFFGVLFISQYLIFTIYGSEYLAATSTLYVIAALIVVDPLINLYSTLFAAKEKAKAISNMLIISLAINILLNYFFIKALLGIGQEYAILGAGAATMLSRFFLLMAFSSKTRINLKISLKEISFFKFIIAGLVMSLFLVSFNSLIDLNLFLGMLEIVLGACVYFGALIIMGGVKKEDIRLIKSLLTK